MISEKMKPYVKNNSAIRMMFEEGNRLRAKYGADKVFDFSLGNPSVPAPDSVREAIIELVNTTDPTILHGYMSNAGFEDVRQTIAESLNRRFATKFSAKNLIMTVGAASGLNVILKTILNPGEEVIVFAPYFLEYGAYVRNYDGVLVEISPDTTTFQPNLAEFEQKITPKTRAVIVNTPHNPTGVVYSEETIKKLSAILEAKQKEFGSVIYLISDEPYRELAYDGVEVPYLTKYYNNTVVGYSYSKSLSLPGERIGYLVIPDEADGSEELISAATIANRTLGCVNAPSLIQKVVAKCVDAKTDLVAYDKNRQALYNGLKECGFECIKPQGAFYLFVKSPVEDEKAFCEAGKKYNILMVPGSSFACPGYVRLAYCVSYETIVNSLPEFKKLAVRVWLVLFDRLYGWLSQRTGYGVREYHCPLYGKNKVDGTPQREAELNGLFLGVYSLIGLLCIIIGHKCHFQCIGCHLCILFSCCLQIICQIKGNLCRKYIISINIQSHSPLLRCSISAEAPRCFPHPRKPVDSSLTDQRNLLRVKLSAYLQMSPGTVFH